MNAVGMLLQDEGVVRLGRTLLHFAWQGAAAAVVAGVLLLTLRRVSAAARYVALLCVFGAMAVCPAVTFFGLAERPAPLTPSPIASRPIAPVVPTPPVVTATEPPPAPAVIPTEPSAPAPTVRASLRERLEANLGWLAAAWALGVLALSLRLAFGWVRLHRTRRAAEDLVAEHWQQTLAALSERLRISRPVRLLHSAAQQTPLVMGWLRPVILLPGTAITGLTPAQFEAILAHELAHIRRHDYVINLAQTVVETLLFYHPAVWWLSGRIRAEREHCCDDLAVAVIGDATGYARALAELEELRAAPRPALAVDGSLLHRVRRLARVSEPRVDIRASWLAAALVLALVLGMGVASRVSRGDAETMDPTLESLIHGLEARGELARRELHSIRGFYTIHKTQREGPREMVPAPGEDQPKPAEGAPKFTPRVGVLVPRWEAEGDFTNTVLVESFVREHSAWVEGRYRNSRRTVSPDERARRQMIGCDGQHYWSYSQRPGSSGPEFVLKEECEEKLVGGEGSWVAWRLGLSDWVGIPPDAGMPWKVRDIRSGNPRLIGEDTINGLTCQVIEYDELDVEGFERLWVCPALGHAVVRSEDEATGYRNLPAGVYVRGSKEYSGFREVLDGLWLPTSVSTKRERQDADGNWVLTGSSEVEVVLLKVNQPVPEEELLPPPQGGTDVLADEKWQWWAWVGGAGSRSDALASEMAGPAEQRKGKPEEEAAAPTDDDAPAVVVEHSGEYLFFITPFYVWKDGESEGEWVDYAISMRAPHLNTTADGRSLQREMDEVRKHGLLVIAPDKTYRVSEEHLPELLQWLKETAVADGSRPKTVQIDAQGLNIGHVIRMVSRSTGAIIALRRGVEGPITLKANLPADTKVVLDAICEAKGLHWWRHDTGAYIVSTRPKPGTSQTHATPQTAADAEEVVYEVIELKFLDPVYVAWLFGQAELPADAFFLPPASLGIGEPDREALAGGEGFKGKGALEAFLPEGIEVLAPVAPGSQQLVVSGTPEAVAELRELIALVDRKPQQVILELTSFRGLPVGADESDFAEGESEHGGAGRGLFLGVWTGPEPPHDAECRHARAATMNLLPSLNTLMDTLPSGLLFVASPRINGDGTITLYADIRRAEWEEGKPPYVETAAMVTRVLAQTAVNVKDGEPVGFVFHFEDFWHTMILAPRIVRETHEED